MAFIVLIAFPLLVAAGGFMLSSGITWREFLAQVFGQVVVAGLSSGLIYCSNTHDVEILNGRVTGKDRVWVSCSHSYRCRCRMVQSCTGSGASRSCSSHEECDTCYRHDNDWDWRVYSSIDESVNIARIDSRGTHEPPRWSTVRIGEPFSSTHSYTNYIKAAPGTLFRHQGTLERFKSHVPAYPGDVYDYYRLRRMVLVGGIKLPDRAAWNEALSELNGRVGARKQANAIVVLARGVPDDYLYALEEAWLGGKKNDVVLLVGVDAALAPRWAAVMAWTTNELFKVKLRDDIMDLTTLTREGVLGALERNIVAHYRRKPMADFEYLAASVTPTTGQWVAAVLFGLLVAFGLLYFFHQQDFFNEQWRQQRWERQPRF